MRQKTMILQTPSGNQKWKVKLTKLRPDEDGTVYGLCQFDKKTISVDDSHGLKLLIQTAIHEATHVALGEDYGEPAVERVEYNSFNVLWPLLEDYLDDCILESVEKGES